MQNGITKKEQRNMDTLYRAKPYIPEVTHQWILRKLKHMPLNWRYITISMSYITIFHNIHEDEIELALFTNNLIELLYN